MAIVAVFELHVDDGEAVVGAIADVREAGRLVEYRRAAQLHDPLVLVDPLIRMDDDVSQSRGAPRP